MGGPPRRIILPAAFAPLNSRPEWGLQPPGGSQTPLLCLQTPKLPKMT